MTGYPIKVAPFANFTRWSKVSIGYVSALMDELGAVQTDYASSVGTFDTLASRLGVLRAASGAWKSDLVSHGVLSPSASQHHAKNHATDHLVGGADAIPLASAAGGGFLAQSNFSKLAGIASNATKNVVTIFSYTGDGNATQAIDVGFAPYRIMINTDDSVATQWGFRVLRENVAALYNGTIQEYAGTAWGHRAYYASMAVSWVGTTILLHRDANKNSRVYRCLVIGE